MKGNRKNHVKKEQNPANQALFGGGFLQLVHKGKGNTPELEGREFGNTPEGSA